MSREATITPAKAVFPNGHTRAAIAPAQRVDGVLEYPSGPMAHQDDKDCVTPKSGANNESWIHTLDFAAHEVVSPLLPPEHPPVKLTPSEFGLLAALAANPLAVVRKEDLLKAMWQDPNLTPLQHDHLLIRIHLSHIRAKLGDREDPQHPGTFRLIHVFEKRGVSLSARLDIQPRDQTSQEDLQKQKELGVRRRLLPDGRELILDDARCLAYLLPEKKEVPLFPGESSILAVLMDQTNKTVPEPYFQNLKIFALKTHIMHLRKSLAPAIISTRYEGYALPSLDEDIKANEFLIHYQTAQGEAVLDTQERTFQAAPGKEPVLLTPIETKLLAAFIKDPDKVFSFDDLCQILWPDPNSEPQDTNNAIRIHLCYLIQKIKPVKIHCIYKSWSLTSTGEYAKAFLAGFESQDAKAMLAPNIKRFANPEGNYYLLTDRNALIFPNGQIAGLRYQQTVIIEVLMQNPHQIFPKGIFKEKGIPEKSLTSNIKDARILGLPIYSHYDQGYSLTPRYGATNGGHHSSDGTVVFESPLHPETIPTK